VKYPKPCTWYHVTYSTMHMTSCDISHLPQSWDWSCLKILRTLSSPQECTPTGLKKLAGTSANIESWESPGILQESQGDSKDLHFRVRQQEMPWMLQIFLTLATMTILGLFVAKSTFISLRMILLHFHQLLWYLMPIFPMIMLPRPLSLLFLKGLHEDTLLFNVSRIFFFIIKDLLGTNLFR
jgi:hypothetical protein